MRDQSERSVTLVLDENLSGHRIVNGLRENGIPVKAQTELMKRGISDPAVLAAVSSHPDHYLLTKDSDFRRRAVVTKAIREHSVGAFVITSHKNKTASDLVDLITRAWPRIERCLRRCSPPFVAKILADGRVELLR